MTNNLTVGVLIPTYQAEKHLYFCLSPLLKSKLNPKILIIDSTSTDNTINIAKNMGIPYKVIPSKTFNHGLTREQGRKLLNTDIVVMMTQDAYPTHPEFLERLIQPIISGEASVSYARQLPYDESGPLGSFAREYNYPAVSHIRELRDAPFYGPYTFFCSNSCAAYSNAALNEIGGFPKVLFGEDTVAVAKLLHGGHRIAYVAESRVKHSHDYTLLEEFNRHFRIGLARQSQQELFAICGKDSKRGKAYAWALLKKLKKSHPALIPYALLQIFAKLLGYRLGQFIYYFPLGQKILKIN